MFKFLIIITLSISLQLVAATTEREKSINSPKPLRKKQGYLLIKLDIEAESSFLYYTQKNKNPTHFINSEKKISLGEYENGFLIIPLKSGKYQISKFEVPFFNYPYYLNTKANEDYSFVIEKDKINFIGALNIKKERTENSINAHLFRDFAKHMDELKTSHPDILKKYPLVSGSNHQDDFINDITTHPQGLNEYIYVY